MIMDITIGYWFSNFYHNKDDIVILISVSENSNVIRAAYRSKELGLKVVTFSQNASNRLKQLEI